MNAAWMVAAHPVACAEVRIQQPKQRPQPHPRRRLTLPTLHRLEPGSDVEQAQARLAEGCAALARVLPHPAGAHTSLVSFSFEMSESSSQKACQQAAHDVDR